jgi:hypothetical protein
MLITSTTLLLIIGAFKFSLTPSVSAAPSDVVFYVNPAVNYFETAATPVGYKFNVTVMWQDSGSPLNAVYAYQINFQYNATLLNCTRAWKPTWNSTWLFYGKSVVGLGAVFRPGEAMVAESLLGMASASSALSPLAIFELEIKKAPPEGGQVSCTLNIDNADTYWLDTDLNEQTPTKTNGTYTYVPSEEKPWLEAVPSEYVAIRPVEFNVSVCIRDLEAEKNLIALQFDLTYNSAVIEVSSVIPGPFMSNLRWAIYGTYPIWHKEKGRVVYGELILPSEEGQWDLPEFPNGEGLVATISFKTLAHMQASFNISVQPLYGECFLDVNNEYIPYNPPKNCMFTYEPLPIPSLKVSPDHYVSSSIGQIFPINITIENLASLWNLTHVEFEVQYNGLSIDATSVTEGTFLSQFGSTSISYDISTNSVKVSITLEQPAIESPSGNGTLATISFNVTSRPPATSALTLNNTLLLDTKERELLYDVSHGYYEMNEYVSHEIVVDSKTFYVTTLSNGATSPVELDIQHCLIKFNVTGETGTVGFINITIPNDLLWADGNWLVIVGGDEVEATATAVNSTHTMLFFNVSFSTKTVYIFGSGVIPEYSSLMLLIFLLAAALSAAATKFHLKRKQL